MMKSKNKPTILVVDDDMTILDWLSLVLVTKGFMVHAAKDAFSAIHICETEKPDLVILDLKLGEHLIQGTEVLWRIKSHAELASTVVLILTGCQDKEVEKLCLDDFGADGYLLKGESPKIKLENIIYSWTRRLRLAGQATELNSGPLHLNFALNQAYVHDKEIPLTPREYNVLSYTVKRSPRPAAWPVLERRLCHEEPPPGETLSFGLNCCLNHLRNKLGAASYHLVTTRPAGLAWLNY